MSHQSELISSDINAYLEQHQQKELLREFDGMSDTNTNPESSGFFAKVKDFWDGFQS